MKAFLKGLMKRVGLIACLLVGGALGMVIGVIVGVIRTKTMALRYGVQASIPNGEITGWALIGCFFGVSAGFSFACTYIWKPEPTK